MCIPFTVHASVVISEVAWMGGEGNANAEWIELYNTGPDVDLASWTLSAVDGQPDIALSGVLGAGQYALLERSSDETVPLVSAFLIYTGALGNDGELLELRNANGLLVDSVDGRGGWEETVGGNNTTKETAQRSGNPPTGAWTTGTPTPTGSAPLAGSTQQEEEEEAHTEPTPVRASGGNIIYPSKEKEERVKYAPALTLDVGSDRTVSQGAPVSFVAHGFSESGRELTTMHVVWNFGDGVTAQGREVTHTYRYEGSYVVTVRAERVGVRDGVCDEHQIIVRVVRPTLEIVEATNTHIAIKNLGDEIADVSGWVLVSDGAHFTIPQRTRILANATVPFAHSVTGVSGVGRVSLFDTNGVRISYTGGTLEGSNTPRVVSHNTSPTTSTKGTAVVERNGTSPVPDALQEEAQAVFGNPTVAVANAHEGVSQADKEATSLWWWIFGLVTAIVTTILAVFLVRREQEEVVQGFLIEEAE